MSAAHVRLVHTESEEGIGSPGTVLTCCEPSSMFWKPNLGTVQESSVTVDPSRPLTNGFCYCNASGL